MQNLGLLLGAEAPHVMSYGAVSSLHPFSPSCKKICVNGGAEMASFHVLFLA